MLETDWDFNSYSKLIGSSNRLKKSNCSKNKLNLLRRFMMTSKSILMTSWQPLKSITRSKGLLCSKPIKTLICNWPRRREIVRQSLSKITTRLSNRKWATHLITTSWLKTQWQKSPCLLTTESSHTTSRA